MWNITARAIQFFRKMFEWYSRVLQPEYRRLWCFVSSINVKSAWVNLIARHHWWINPKFCKLINRKPFILDLKNIYHFQLKRQKDILTNSKTQIHKPKTTLIASIHGIIITNSLIINPNTNKTINPTIS
jgi:hypothetical protein